MGGALSILSARARAARVRKPPTSSIAREAMGPLRETSGSTLTRARRSHRRASANSARSIPRNPRRPCVVVELEPPEGCPDLAVELEVLALPWGRSVGFWLDSRTGAVLGMVGAGLA